MRQKYYTQILVGGDIHRFLHNHAQIIARARTIFKNATLRKQDAAADIEARVDRFLDYMLELMRVFDMIYMFMSQTTQLTDEEITRYEFMLTSV